MPLPTLGGVCEAIVDCEHKTAPLNPNGAFFAVGTPAMRGNRIDYSEARRIDRATFEEWTRRLRPNYGDLLLAREAPVGPVVMIPREEHVAPGQRTVLIRPNRERVDAKYLYYLLSSPAEQYKLQGLAEGSTVPHLNVADIRALTLPMLPTMPEQRAIATLLGALDDKVEANRKLAATADALAAAEFKRAANGVPLSESTFADVAVIGGGGTPRSKEPDFWGGEVQWLTPTDVTGLPGPYINETSRTITEAGLASISSPLYPVGSIAMTSRATIGAFAILGAPMAVNQGFIVVQPNDPSMRYWLFHEMRRRTSEFLDHANGATFMELSRGNFKQLRVHLAAFDTMATFNARAEALHDVARTALRENEHLSNLRDTLLPKLMSGALKVREAQRLVAQAV